MHVVFIYNYLIQFLFANPLSAKWGFGRAIRQKLEKVTKNFKRASPFCFVYEKSIFFFLFNYPQFKNAS